MERNSLIDYLDIFRHRGSECAYVHRRGYRTERWSYRQIAETAFQFARELEALQIGTGDHVVLWGENCAEWVIAFFGCLLRGVIVVPMDDASASDFVLRVSQQIHTKLLVGSRKHLEQNGGFSAISLEDLADRVAQHSNAPYSAVELKVSDTLVFV